jgi:hypothetical protein
VPAGRVIITVVKDGFAPATVIVSLQPGQTGPDPTDVDGRWTVDAWAPLDGRSVNGGLRVRF